MLFVQFLLPIFIFYSYDSLLTNGNSQPWPLHIEKIGHCCSELQFTNRSAVLTDSILLRHCLTENHLESTIAVPITSTISILSLSCPGTGTFSINNIEYYSSYQFGILGSYCEQRYYHCHLLSQLPFNYTEKYPLDDFRWYKVPLIMDGFDTWGMNQTAIVWIDFNLAIEEILSLYPAADIIASADIKLGLVNTGFMIFRNTAWTKQFLRQWWEVADKDVTCDQDAFDQLYIKLVETPVVSTESGSSIGTVEKVKILSTDQLNSHPPAWQYHQNNPVLHLMGEMSLYRAEVFRRGFYSICKARSGGILPPLLNIHQGYLLDAARSIYREQTQQTFIVANQTGNLSDYEEFSQASHHYVDILQYDLERIHDKFSKSKAASSSSSSILSSLHNSQQQQMKRIQDEIIKIRQTLFYMCLYQVEDLEKLVKVSEEKRLSSIPSQNATTIPSIESLEEMFIYQNETKELIDRLLHFKKKAAEAGNSYFWSLPGNLLTQKQQVSEQILQILNDLADRVDSQSQLIPLHMKALLFQNVGIMYYEEYQRAGTQISDHTKGYLANAKQNTLQSLEIFDRFFSKSKEASTLLEYLHSIQLLAAIYCIEKQYSQGFSTWQRAIDQAYKATSGLKVGIHYEKLSIVLYNAAICYQEGNQSSKAIGLLQQAQEVLTNLIHQKKSKQESIYNKQMDDLQYLLTTVTTYLKGIQQNQSRSNSPSATISSDIEPNQEKIPVMKMIRHPDGSIQYIAQSGAGNTAPTSNDDGYEWEECSNIETEDCESFYVLEESSVAKDFESIVFPASEVSVDNESHLYEGLSEDERNELLEIRKRYAQATAISKEAVNDPSSHKSSEPSRFSTVPPKAIDLEGNLQTKIVELLEQKIQLMEQLEKLKQENMFLRHRLKQISLLSQPENP